MDETPNPTDRDPFPPLGPRFVPEKVLGSGGMGVVWRVHDRELGRAIAIKVIRPGRDIPDLLQRFAREALGLAQISHPNVLKILDAVIAPPPSYLAMELLEGIALAEVLGRHVLAQDAAAHVLTGILAGLEVVHGAGILHRDLKPANIILRDGREPVIIDFGVLLADGATRLTTAGAAVGTICYMAPELLGAGDATVRSDLFGVALIGVEALTGADIHRVAHAPNPVRVVVASLASGLYFSEARIALEPHGRLGRAILRALSPDGADRYASAQEMSHAIRAAVAAAGTSFASLSRTPASLRTLPRPAPGGAPRPVTTGQATGVSGASRLRYVAGTVGLIIVALVGALVWWQPWKSDPVRPDPTTSPVVGDGSPDAVTDWIRAWDRDLQASNARLPPEERSRRFRELIDHLAMSSPPTTRVTLSQLATDVFTRELTFATEKLNRAFEALISSAGASGEDDLLAVSHRARMRARLARAVRVAGLASLQALRADSLRAMALCRGAGLALVSIDVSAEAELSVVGCAAHCFELCVVIEARSESVLAQQLDAWRLRRSDTWAACLSWAKQLRHSDDQPGRLAYILRGYELAQADQHRRSGRNGPGMVQVKLDFLHELCDFCRGRGATGHQEALAVLRQAEAELPAPSRLEGQVRVLRVELTRCIEKIRVAKK